MKVDLLVQNGWVYRTYRQCFEKMDIAVVGERFYDISPSSFHGNEESDPMTGGTAPEAAPFTERCTAASHKPCFEAECVVDASGKYIIPGLIDIHMHIESSMTYPGEFSRAVLPWGVTCVVADPHEIANVFGLEGIKSLMEQETELDIYYGIPSSVPSTRSELETSGGVIGEEEVRELLKNDKVICLGEVMNDLDLVSVEDTRIKRIVSLCRNGGRRLKIEGHCPALSGEDLAGFIRGGVDADHTQQTRSSVLEKTDMGMFLELQAKSLTSDVVETVISYGLYENVALVTDDTMPDHLVKGHLNQILRLAVEQGMPPEKAIYCATLTPARRMGLDDRGMIAPGKLADFVVLDDLAGFCPSAVYKNGKQHIKNQDSPKAVFPDHFYQSVKCRLALASDFKLNRCEIREGTATVNVMEIQDFGTRVRHGKRVIPIRNRCLCWQEAGLCLAAVFERYGKTGDVSYGLVDHALQSPGAVATTWSHDSHNLLVLGNSVEDMVLAQNRVVHMQGGYVTAREGKITSCASLPVGGILSDGSLLKLSGELGGVREEIQAMGYVNSNVIMSISTLTLLVSPDLKISDKGLFDVKTKEAVPLVEKQEQAIIR
ncbi:adenine deaminase C-terminal domain-containing protein [Lacrimispora saccharolytica]|uniref:Adenine deaminase n=1 Tax=Lacrimispora saccharolytica (strain ATCC 35040 / DSM 2544 / NRCC 2533 / WM1) TaxID=610130 RepID=D9R7S1_LACSW|nr:adenine deaminase C-terminal domain-containing protein [Lacrimispora saccharolytica]ADL05575.1 Adenine deaminase [[Clostridium] saccharolyticum WM1]QRV20265.1 amidohydrolase family protein [Lacrimispora saccharolytica]